MMTNRRLTVRSFAGLILILVIGVGLLIFQNAYLRKQMPLIAAELAAAENDGPKLIEAIKAPPGSAPYSDGIKSFPGEGRKSNLQGTKTGVIWSREWESPGSFEEVERWYSDQLGEIGWRLDQQENPSVLVTEYRQGKWLLSILRGADFSTDREPKVRYQLVLDWRYSRSIQP